jgi:carbamoyl-phosphate synthase large subunit
LQENNIQSTLVRKAKEGEPNILNLLSERKVSLLVNIPRGPEALEDNMSMRRLAILMDLSLITTMSGAQATVEAMKSLHKDSGKGLQSFNLRTIQEYMALST